ncbi:MAG: RNA polymerase sigma factor region1.1 domain-containing protein, partial [Pseudomonadota bacterium]
MASKAAEQTETPAKPSQDGPLLDMTDQAVKKMIARAKQRGYVTYDELNEVFPSEQVSSEQIEDTMSMLSEMGINVIDADDVEEVENAKEGAANGTALAARETTSVTAKETTTTELDRTDDPVRMYLREMGSVELLSREGEIAIAKRIEAGRETMIQGLCESPLTFEAIIVWRDELNEGRVLLRDIIDLDATYGAGPDAEGNMPGTEGFDATTVPPRSDEIQRPEPPAGSDIQIGNREAPAANGAGAPAANGAAAPAANGAAAPAANGAAGADAPAAADGATQTEGASQTEGGEQSGEGAREGGDDDLDADEDQGLSLAAMEAALKPQILDIFDKIAAAYKKLRKLQDATVDAALNDDKLTPAQERRYKKLRNEIVSLVRSLHLNNNRIEALVEQLYGINKRLMGLEGKLMRVADSYGV